MIRVLSLGAGVQSTTMALMAANGELDMPDCAIFADTGWEPRRVYQHLVALEGRLPFTIHRVAAGNLRDDIMRATIGRDTRVANPPFFTRSGFNEGFLRRSCTQEYKIDPIQKKLRQLVNPGRRERRVLVTLWLGISTDEAARAKPSRVSWIKHEWPLIDRGMSRRDCLRWIEKNGHTQPPKSSCIGCPFHSDAEWRRLRDTSPDEWQDAINVDRAIRGGIRGTLTELFLHRARVPLDQVDLSTAEDRGQLNMFNNECEGMCGV